MGTGVGVTGVGVGVGGAGVGVCVGVFTMVAAEEDGVPHDESKIAATRNNVISRSQRALIPSQ